MVTVCGSGGSEASETAEAVTEAATSANARLDGAAPQLGLVFVSPRHELGEAIAAAERAVPAADWMGCSTAGEITDAGCTRGGVSVMLLSWGAAAHRLAPACPLEPPIPALASKLCADFPKLIDRAHRDGWPHAITVTLGDGMSPDFERIVSEVRRATRLHHTLVGGGAADDGALVRSWTGTGGRTFEGGVAATHVVSARQWGVGIGQGARARTERMTVTRSEANVVHELDGRAALDVYRDYADGLGVTLDEATTGSFLIQNELGIYLFDDIVRVRAGLATTEEGAISFAGEVPEGSTVAIVRAEPDEMIEAARVAAESALASIEGPAAGVLLFSCVTRAIVLGDRICEELAAVVDVFGRGVPIAGFSSYGEVGRVRGKHDGYHNHTLVVVAIPE